MAVELLLFPLLEPQWDRLSPTRKELGPIIQDILDNHPFGEDNETLTYMQLNDMFGLSSCTIKNVNKSSENQDVTLIYITPNRKTKIGAVFDGHAPYGLYAAAIAAATLKKIIDKYITYFETKDADFITEAIVPYMYSMMHKNINDGVCEVFGGVTYNGVIINGNYAILGGTTCSIVISHVDVDNRPSTIYSYVGDSDIYKVTPTGLVKVSKYEHSPSNKKEMIPRDRIEDGGYVIGDAGWPLQMTRSLGDLFMGSLQNHTPTVVVEPRLDTVFIGSDGLWDLLTQFNTDQQPYIPGLKDEVKQILESPTIKAQDILEQIVPLIKKVRKFRKKKGLTDEYDDISLVIMTDGNGLTFPETETAIFSKPRSIHAVLGKRNSKKKSSKKSSKK